MNRKLINWKWEDPDAQESFAEWVGFPDEQKTSKEVDRIELLLGLRPPLTILDVGCGTGRHSIELAGRGYHVTAIDVAAGYLEKAGNEAKRKNLTIDFRRQRGGEICEREAYDFILACDHTLGFMSDEELSLHFNKIFTALKPSGKFLLVIAGPRLIPGMEIKKTNSWTERNGKFILEEKYMENGYRIEHCIVIDMKKDEIKEFCERQKAFSLEDVKSLLGDAGFKKINCLKDLYGTPASPEEFCIFVCN